MTDLLAAALLGYTVGTVYRLARAGRLHLEDDQ